MAQWKVFGPNVTNNVTNYVHNAQGNYTIIKLRNKIAGRH